MADLDNHHHKLQESLDELIHVRQFLSGKDYVIKDLRASKRSVVQELEAARLAVKAAEDASAILRAQRFAETSPSKPQPEIKRIS